MARGSPTRRDVLLAACGAAVLPAVAAGPAALYAVPNFHPGCMGWLAPYHVERNYCLYSYLDHLDLAAHDPTYRFAFSEIPHLITMREFEPGKFAEFKKLVDQGSIELVNAFVLEPTINLSGGEALVMQGVEGLRWYSQVMKTRPRHCWMIDVTGWHEQMAQIVEGLGLESFVYCRYNPQGPIADDNTAVPPGSDTLHWLESPDGTRILAVNPGHYSGALKRLMEADRQLPPEQVVSDIDKLMRAQAPRFPKGAPLLALASTGDYSLAFRYRGYPAAALQAWQAARPDQPVAIATFSDWFEAIKPGVRDGRYALQTVRSGSGIYGWTAFWVNAPAMKQRYRRAEHALQSVEALAGIASLRSELPYPSQEFSNSWFLMALNMDRALLWGVAVNGIFRHEKAWDTCDRFEYVERTASRATIGAFRALAGEGRAKLGLFNPCDWERSDVFELWPPPGTSVAGATVQPVGEHRPMLVRAHLPSMGIASFELTSGAPPAPAEVPLPEVIETEFYAARLDPATGALASLRLKPSGREVLGGPANVVLAQVRDPRLKHREAVHSIPARSGRVTVVSSSDARPRLAAYAGPLATVVEMVCSFRGGELRRSVRFYPDSPRIEFETETSDLPDGTIVTVEFPLAGEIAEVRRGIPYGFAHAPWGRPNPRIDGLNRGILPVIRWSHYTLAGGGGVALLDRGVPGRELDGSTAILLLHNANDRYYWDRADWMSGQGTQPFQYALLAHETAWEQARIPRRAWEYNARPLAALCDAALRQPFVETSQNVIVEALRRTGDEIELRLVECLGLAGPATVQVHLPHGEAALTSLTGDRRRPLRGRAGVYRFELRPQQIVTLRLKAERPVAPVEALATFDPVVPEHKRAYTRGFRHPELKGHPPQQGVPVWKTMGA